MASAFSIRNHRLVEASYVASPNCDARPPDGGIDLLVIHNISLPPGEFGTGCVQRLFRNDLDCDAHPYFDRLRELRVSAHLLIERSGALYQFVDFDRRAWHAGQSEYCGRSQCNDFSLGIELEGTDEQAFTATQYRTLTDVTCALMDTYPALNMERIVGHSDIAPGRKTDPGPCFDWRRYRADLQERYPAGIGREAGQL
ncbi:MAG: 1,6-anhydro-N-acetylmuramyl-L-alanine amidase AmpD [Pseudohongiellaceae bacterium]